MKRVLVAGAGGLIGGHLVKLLLDEGFLVRAVGRSPVNEWRQHFEQAENIVFNLSEKTNAYMAVKGMDWVFNLAADIGGVNYIEKNKARLMLSVLINTHLLMAVRDEHIERYFYASTHGAAVADIEGPKALEDGHLWEKLFSERLTKYFGEDFGMNTRIGRFQNVYGFPDVYDGGRERAPAALCRKAILAKQNGESEIEIWGDGTQKRSFLYVNDAAAGARTLMESEITEPTRIGSNEIVSIEELADMVIEISGIPLKKRYNLSAPRGIERALEPEPRIPGFDWAPKVSMREGMERLYHWIEQDMKAKGKI